MKSHKISLKVKSELDSFCYSNQKRIDEVRKEVLNYFSTLVAQNKDVVNFLLQREQWTVSKLIFINESGNRMYTHLLVRNFEWKHTEMDFVMEIIGAKVNDQWYYLNGTTTYLSREAYKNDLTEPLTYEELDFSMNSGLYQSIVTKENGKHLISDLFFKNKFGVLDSTVSGSDEEFVRRATDYKPRTVSKSDLDRVQKKRMESEPPKRYNQFFWKNWFRRKKFFDSKGWRNVTKAGLYE